MAAVPTIKVHYNGSWALINESDFDPQIHLEWQDGDEVIVEQLKEKAEAEAQAAAAAEIFRGLDAEDAEPTVPQGAQDDGSEPPTEVEAEPVADEPVESEDSEDEEQVD